MTTIHVLTMTIQTEYWPGHTHWTTSNVGHSYTTLEQAQDVANKIPILSWSNDNDNGDGPDFTDDHLQRFTNAGFDLIKILEDHGIAHTFDEPATADEISQFLAQLSDYTTDISIQQSQLQENHTQ